VWRACSCSFLARFAGLRCHVQPGWKDPIASEIGWFTCWTADREKLARSSQHSGPGPDLDSESGA
jgi:hypothetical protein